MALSDPVSLPDAAEDVVGVQWCGIATAKPAEVLLTTHSRIAVVEPKARAVTHEWVFRARPGQGFSCAAVHHASARLVVAVQHRKVLCTFSDTDMDLSTLKQKTMPSPCFALHSHARFGPFLLATTEEGALQFWSTSLEESFTALPATPGSSLRAFQLLTFSGRSDSGPAASASSAAGGGTTLVGMSVMRGAHGAFTVSFSRLRKSVARTPPRVEDTVTHALPAPAGATDVLAACYVRHAKSLCVAWSDGSLAVLHLPGPLSSFAEPPTQALQRHLGAPPAGAPAPALAALEPAHMVVVGGRQDRVTAWDVAFGVQTAHVALPPTPPPPPSLHVCVAPDLSCGVAARGRRVTLFSARAERPSLARALNRLAPSATAGPASLSSLTEDTTPALAATVPLESVLRRAEEGEAGERHWRAAVSAENEPEAKAVRSLLAAADAGDRTRFLAVFVQFVAELARRAGVSLPAAAVVSADGDGEEQQRAAKRKRAAAGKKEARSDKTIAALNALCDSPAAHHLPFSHHFTAVVAAVSLSRPQLQLWTALRVVLRSGRLAGGSVATLVPTLLAHKQLVLLEDALLFVRDIPESHLLQVLRYSLAARDEEQLAQLARHRAQQHARAAGGAEVEAEAGAAGAGKRGKRKRRTDEAAGQAGEAGAAAQWVELAPPRSERDAAVENLFCLAVSSPRNDVFLQRCLRRLSPAEVDLVLVLLKKFLFLYSRFPVRQLPATRAHARLPSMSAVTDWLSLLLDAHFSRLVVRSGADGEVQARLEEVQQLVQQEIQVCDTIEAISGHLSILKDKISLPVGPSPDYSVEALVL